MNRLRLFMAGGVAAIAATIALFAVASASNSVIDFEGLTEGAIVSSVSAGSGISGDDAGGSVAVSGLNPVFGAGTNAAVIFDGTCTGGCTGGDVDLEFPANKNILIVGEDLVDSNGDGLVDDPDDADVTGASIDFDFSGWGSGVVTVNNLDIADVEFAQGETGAEILLYSGGLGGTLLATVPIPNIGNHNIQNLPIGVGNVDFMRVTLNGSGAIDNIDISADDPENPAIDIEKFTRADDTSTGDDLCDTLGKPQVLTMMYSDDPDPTSHSQDDGKVVVDDFEPLEADVRIITSDKEDPADSKAKIWSNDLVSTNGEFMIDATNVAGEDDLKSNTYIHVFDPSGTTLLQTVKFHTSCSQPLFLGDQFGSAKLTGFLDKDGGSAQANNNQGFGDDADQPTGPEITVGDKVIWTYVVTNPGDVELSNIVVTDDNGTDNDTSDDFNPDPILANGFNVGDTDMDNRLDNGEEWLYMDMGTVVEGQYANIGTVVGTSPNGTEVDDFDPSHHIGVLPANDQCDDGKPQVLTMMYSDDPDPTSHSQDDGKVVVDDFEPLEADVRIITSDKEDPADSKAKIWSNDLVSTNGEFMIDATNVAGEDDLKSNTYIHVFDPSGTTLLQTVKFHTSCSQPLFLGDQFGSAKLTGFVPK